MEANNHRKVHLKSGEEKRLKYGSVDQNHRAFTVLPGMHMIGLTGEVAPVSLALIQRSDKQHNTNSDQSTC
jgi:hypothetical protein